MLAADTNVWVRAYLNDDASQAGELALPLRRPVRRRGSSFRFLSWRSCPGFSAASGERERVLNTMEALLETRGVTIEPPSIVWRALEASRKSTAGFADHLIAEISFESGVGEIITFDKAFSRRPGVRRLK